MPTKKRTRQTRSIDRAARESRTWLSKKMVIVHKKKISTLRGFLIIAFVAGAVSALVWMVNVNIETSSKAGSAPDVKSDSNAAPKFVKGELLIKFKSEVSDEEQVKLLNQHGAKVKDEIQQIKVKRISVPEKAQDQVREALSKNPNVEFVENNALAEATLTPNDPSFASQWQFSKISAATGWDISTGSTTTPITICDSGIDLTHPDLAGKLLPGYNFYDYNTNNADVQGHGTAVAGSAAAISNNGVGVAGVAWANPIIPVRISDASAWATYSAMANCITFGVDNGSRVINLSYGGTNPSSTLQSAVDYAWSKNAVVFASAGNAANSTPEYPAATNHVIGVIATDSSNNKASFSSYGTWADIAAPGASIVTTSRGGGYGAWSGTSFSSPIAAGLAALVISVNPSLSSQDIYEVMTKNTDDLGAVGFDPTFAWGKINIEKTLAAAKTYVPQADTTSPNISITAPANGATVSGTTSVGINASDNVDVKKVELYKNGTLLTSSTTYPYNNVYWDTMKEANGTYTLQAKAYDVAGNVGTSSQITVTVNNVIPFSVTSSSASSTGTAVTVKWSSSEASRGTVYYGTSSAALTAAASDNVDGTSHAVVLGGLKANTTYYYQVKAQSLDGTKTASGNIGSVRTKRK